MLGKNRSEFATRKHRGTQEAQRRSTHCAG
jgi:hypothetical protein